MVLLPTLKPAMQAETKGTQEASAAARRFNLKGLFRA